MKPDVFTVTALVFVVGVLISSTGITGKLDAQRDVPPPAIHQGLVLR